MELSDVISFVKAASPEELGDVVKAVNDATEKMASTAESSDEMVTALNALQETLNTDEVFGSDISIVYSAGNGLIVIPSLIRDVNKAGDHDCIGATVSRSVSDMTKRSSTFWSFDEEAPGHVKSKTVKIGAIRRSADVYRLIPGMVVAFHNRNKRGNRHSRIETKAFELYPDGDDIEMREVPLQWTELPIPGGVERDE